MEWLIGITGRNKVPSSSAGNTPRRVDDIQKPYVNDKTLLSKISKDELKETVQLPTGVDPNEWLATNTLSFFNHISLMQESLHEFCTSQTCSNMSSGAPNIWHDKGKKVRLSAPEYIDLVITHVQKYVTDETVFPTKYDMTFPTNFLSVIKKVFKLLFHVLVHIYQSHYNDMDALQQSNLLNTVFIHFMYFQTEHSILEPKDISSFDDLIKSLCL
ncbi:MOB kinase activator 2-like [Clytia hemisphaerica]|uniref:Uncharacterized protein n=1 Tax=Clytia hemisphaerica TaxID=252671 RepID=A0A7M5X1T2_9CNID|eukprot:TCONS_00024101-protein